jgi:hypothetical protein
LADQGTELVVTALNLVPLQGALKDNQPDPAATSGIKASAATVSIATA